MSSGSVTISTSSPSAIDLIGVVVVALLAAFFIKLVGQSRNLKLPPGPRGLPIIGNVLQYPAEHPATYFKELQVQYGRLMYLNMNGTPLIVISDEQLARELLEKRALQYSSRPVLPFTDRYWDPTGIYWPLFRQGENYFHGRKISASLMNTVKAGQTEGLQRFEVLLTVQHLLEDGGTNWYEHVKRETASATLGIMFGIHCPKGDEPELQRVLDTTRELICSTNPSFTVLNMFPILDYIPGPMPWRTVVKKMRERERLAFQPLMTEAIEGFRSPINTWASVFAKHKTDDGKRDRRELMKPFIVAAIDTTATTLHNFVLACILYPHFVSIAQKELDAVVGTDRLPTFSDRPRLPYIEAVVRELLRWRPAARTGIPRETTEEDRVTFNGEMYTIPKGSIVIYNVWAMEHNEEKFPEPNTFRPDRFLDADGLLKADYSTTVFGFGRRECAGIPFAERSIFINIALFLWTFNIKKSPDLDPESGSSFHYDDSDAAFDGMITNGAHKFPALFEPRDPERVAVARREWEYCEKDLEQLLPQRNDF